MSFFFFFFLQKHNVIVNINMNIITPSTKYVLISEADYKLNQSHWSQNS